MRKWFREKMRKLRAWAIAILISIGVLAPPLLMADDINLQWTNATEWEDGTTLEAGDLVETVIEFQAFPLGVDLASEPRSYTELDRVPPTVQSYVHANQANGVYCYIGYHVASNGQRSVDSNEACKTVDVRLPGPPTGLTAN